MRESKFLVILIIISIFAIILSIFWFLRNRSNNEEITEDTIIQDDNINQVENTDLTKENNEGKTKILSEETANNSVVDVADVDVKEEVDVKTEVIVTKNVPQAPTLMSAPFSTSKDSESVEVNGEPNAEIFVNEWSVGFLDGNGKKIVSLNTAGGDGDKSFSIFLRNEIGKSGILNLVIKKVTTTSTTNVTTSANTNTTSTRKTWSYIYTNQEKFDIDDYRDDDIEEINLRDVCRENKGVVTYCYKTGSLDNGTNNTNLGNTKCPSSCTKGQTCLLWNKEEKSSGSIYSWVAFYRCE